MHGRQGAHLDVSACRGGHPYLVILQRGGDRGSERLGGLEPLHTPVSDRVEPVRVAVGWRVEPVRVAVGWRVEPVRVAIGWRVGQPV